jgi:hypothetical protein
MMGVVAALAVASGAVSFSIRAGERRRVAARHAEAEVYARRFLEQCRDGIISFPGENPEVVKAVLSGYSKAIPYHADQRRKWERAAWTPWLSVAPDPPAPEWRESRGKSR